MATNFTSTTLSGTFNDDYSDSDHYHQILFRSGRALQARELTQMQTLMYREMSRFGSNIFKEGALVNGGGLSANGDYIFLQVHTTTGTGGFAGIPVGTILSDGNIRCKVVEVQPLAGQFVTDTLYIQYIDGGNTVQGSTPPEFAAGAELNGGGYTITLKGGAGAVESPATAHTGRGVRVDVAAGDFFVLGRFVQAQEQSLIIRPYDKYVDGTTSADADLGFKVRQLIINVNDNVNLYDNAGENINQSSPGAERYQILLDFTTRAAVAVGDTFVFIGRAENGKIVESVQTADGYNKINDVMALRTQEESGDYIVNPFTVDFDSADDANLAITVSSGLAYVNGYRVENPSAIELIVPRSQSTELVLKDTVPVVYGNYVEVQSSSILPVLNNYATVNLYSDAGSTTIGTTRVRGVEPFTGGLRLYLFDVELNSGKGFDSVQGIGTSSTALYTIGPDPAQLFGGQDNDLLMPTSRPRCATLDDVLYVDQRSAEVVATAGTFPLPALGANESYANTGDWLIANTDDPTDITVQQPTSITGTTADTAGGTDGNYRLTYYVQTAVTSNFAAQSKTLTAATNTLTVSAGVANIKVGSDDVVDVANVTVIKQDTSGGVDVSERFIFDDGQRDNYYDVSKLILKEGETDPGTIYVEFTYFQRNGTNNFFGPGSYDGIPYADIPEHTLKDGTNVSLRNFLDFRPDKNAANSFANVKFLPQNGTSITADADYYLPRADKLIATQEGDIQVLMGQQSRNPQLKPTPDNSLELYQILMNANTHSADDIQIRPIEHKRYTMKDIAGLEAKVDDLTSYTELNIAELRALHNPSLDSAGNERPEAGFNVDPVQDQSQSDTDNGDYAAAIDPENNLIRPMIDEDNIRLIMETDGTLSTNVLKKGDNVYLDYTHQDWKFQDIASNKVAVNPFGKVDNVGVIKLSPSSDEWKDSKEEAVKAIAGTSRVDTKQAFLWNNWQWNWKGRTDEDVWHSAGRGIADGRGSVQIRSDRYQTDQYSSETGSRNNRGFVRRVVSRDTIRKRIGRRYVDLALIPWIRSRKIFFKAQGLKPNTKFTPFFDGKDVSAWCKTETAFVQWADRLDDNGNLYTWNSLAAHPDGTTELKSDQNGEVIGSFWIPNLRPSYYLARKNRPRRIRFNYLRFRAGVREFKLLDINENNWAAADSKAFSYYTVQGSMWHKWRNILTTRGNQTRWPLPYSAGFPAAFSPQEMKKALDAVSNTDVGFYKPQIAGQYGPQTNPVVLSSLNGEMSQVLSDYVNVNNKQFFGNNVLSVTLPQNPLSQTFYVDNQFGAVLTKVSLYFQTIDTTSNQPISVHIRPVVDGKPSNTEIVPDSHVFMLPNNSSTYDATKANAIGIEPALSTILTKPSVFEFTEPVFLQPWTEYAIVITSASTEYKIFSARTREAILGNPGRTVSTQPQLGKLFLPQTGVWWIESKEQDLMMKLERAKFDVGGGTLLLKNAELPAKALDENPIKLTTATPTVAFVAHHCHGHKVGDYVRLSGATDIGNILEADINDINLLITKADITGYEFTLPNAKSSTANISGGGTQVLATRNSVFDTANPTVETIIPNFTSAEYSAKFISGAYSSQPESERFLPNGASGTIIDAKYEKITPDVNIEFDKPRAIFHRPANGGANVSADGVFTQDGTSGLGGGTAGGNESAYVKVDLKTSNDYVSPIVDLQRASLALVGACIDDPSLIPSDQINPQSETLPSGGNTGSKHITTPVTLAVPASGIDVTVDLNLPNGAFVDFYYRTCAGDENLANCSWILKAPELPIPNTAPGVFVRANYLPGDKGGTLTPFTQVQTKFVMGGTHKGPQLREIGNKYLASN
tara:strand:+ start:24600 stop:30083 length:5484 start_codon:yes stop_codon:yes gene_type:complete